MESFKPSVRNEFSGSRRLNQHVFRQRFRGLRICEASGKLLSNFNLFLDEFGHENEIPLPIDGAASCGHVSGQLRRDMNVVEE